MWSAAHYRAVVDTAVDAILVIDDHGVVQTVNRAVMRIFGYEAAELVGQNVKVLMPPSDAQSHDRHLQGYQATGERKVIGIGRSVFGRRKDGSVFPAALSVAEWRSESGARFFTGIIRDTSEIHAAAAALEESQEWLRTVSDTALVGLVVLDSDHRVRFANRAFAVLFGLASSDIAGFNIAEILPENYHTELRERLEATFAGSRRSYPDAFTDTRGSGVQRHLTATFEPSRNAHGDAVAVVVITDVTDLKRSEADLKANRDLLQSVLDGTLDAIFAKNEAGRYVVLNETGAHLIGRTRAEAIGQTDNQLFAHDAAEELRRQDRQVMNSGEASVHDQLLTVDGQERQFVVTKRPWMDRNGRARGVVGIAREVTEQRLLAEERRAVAKRLLQAQEQERLRIARDLHDQVGQDVTGLSLGLKSLERFLDQEPLGLAKLTWLRGLTDQISKNLHRNALELRATALDDLGLREAIASHVAELAGRFDLRADLYLDDLDLCALDIDARLAMYRGVQEALTNILKHAAATTVSVVAQYSGAELRIIVEDDGKGFDVDIPCQLADSGGLGLIGLRERFSLVGGSVNVESAIGRGTSVFLTLQTA